MKVFVLGKLGSIVHWAEDCVAGLRAEGHEVRFGVTRDPRFARAIEDVLEARWLGVPKAVWITRAIRRFSPDLILAVGPYGMPLSVMERVAAMPGRAPLMGWAGDQFEPADAAMAALFDLLAYTDSGLRIRHGELGFASPTAYLPHAANPRLDRGVPAPQQRDPSLVFVANPTPQRQAIVAAIRTPIQIYGPGWEGFTGSRHAIRIGRVGIDALAEIYRSHLGVLNIRNEGNVLSGLNQRNFDPYLAGTPVVTDDQPDLASCFEPGKEVLVYHDTDELNGMYERLRQDPAWALAIGAAGRARVRAEHTYGRRIEALRRMT